MIHPDFTPAAVWTGAGYLDITRPRGPFRLADIARGLARRARFGGHTMGDWPYSVAQHSVLVADMAATLGLSRDLERAALLHDAAEALTGIDVPRPIKRLPAMADFCRREDDVQFEIEAQFDISDAWDGMVAALDFAALCLEKRWLIRPEAGAWPGVPHPDRDETPITPLDAPAAERLFLHRAAELGLADEVAA